MLSLQFQNLQPAISHTFCFFIGLWPLKLLLCTSSLRSSQINVMLINVLHLFLHCEQCKYNPMNFVVLTATFCLVSVVFTTSYTLNFLLLFRFKRFSVLLRSFISPLANASRFFQICIYCLHRTFLISSIFSIYPSLCRTSSKAFLLLIFCFQAFR